MILKFQIFIAGKNNIGQPDPAKDFVRDIRPLNDKTIRIEWSRANNEVYYTKKISGELIFIDEDYKFFKTIEDSDLRYETIELRIFEKCIEGWKLTETGFFSSNLMHYDLENCTCTLKEIRINDLYDTVKGFLNNDINITGSFLESDKIVIASKYPVEWAEVIYDGSAGKTLNNGIVGPPPSGEGWHVYNYGVHTYLSTTVFDKPFTIYVRQNNNGTYKRGALGDFCKNVHRLNDVILFNFSLNKFNVVSDFLQINPRNPSTINYVTGIESNVNNLFIGMVSDAVKPQSTELAGLENTTLNAILVYLRNVFNLYWAIEKIGNSNVIRIEHLSYFENRNTLNLLTDEWKEGRIENKKYTYLTDDLPQTEIWKYTQYDTTGLFKESTIRYNQNAVTQNKTEIKDLSFALADVTYLDRTKEEGFFMFSCRPMIKITDWTWNRGFGAYTYSVNYAIIIDDNDELRPQNFVNRYHKRGRILIKGELDGTMKTFESQKPIKKQADIKLIHCCESPVFIPESIFTTSLSTSGILNKATKILVNGEMTLEIHHGANETGALELGREFNESFNQSYL